MYYVYRLMFDSCVYVGCTNDIVRRKDQHNENARKLKSKFGRFLQANEIVLKKDDFQIVFESEDRGQALNREKEITVKMEKDGFTLLNDNYSKECTRKGKNLGKTSREWAVIDYLNHTVTYIKDLRQYSIVLGVDYKAIQRTHKVRRAAGRYIALHKEEWDGIEDKDYYLSGKFADDIDKAQVKAVVSAHSKEYEVMFPDGHVEKVRNLDKFARDHNLTSGTLHATYTKGKTTKGYKVIRRI